MLVYRDTARMESAAHLVRALLRAVKLTVVDVSGASGVEALLRASALECTLTDLGDAYAPEARRVGVLVEALATHALAPRDAARSVAVAADQLATLTLPPCLRVTTPEGYAFYALEPRDYGRTVAGLELPEAELGVIGIRSIGTSLSAIVQAALRQRERTAERISVRPTGHPWARELSFSRAEQAWVRERHARGAGFLVVDEGPGLSGSTFLAVAEALERAGVAPSRIRLLCSHQPSVENLTAPDAALRWRRYASFVPPPAPAADGSEDLSAGAWRRLVFGSGSSRWPACWTQLERIKRRSADGCWLDKFEGFSPYHQPALARAQRLAAAGFAPAPIELANGFVRSRWLVGRPGTQADLEPGVLERLAEYCAFRVGAFAAPNAAASALREMLEVNVRECFGVELQGRVPLEVHTPMVPDARMQPHKWSRSPTGAWRKLDGHGDGDGHLLPGPTDVCWDVAGAIIEWGMNEAQQHAFLRSFERRTGEHVAPRLPSYSIAYSALRVGALSLARLGANPEEAARLERERARHVGALARMLEQQGVRVAQPVLQAT